MSWHHTSRDLSLADVPSGWLAFKAERCKGLAPATVDRFRATLQAALNYGCAQLEVGAPKIPPIRFSNKRIRWLTINEQEALLGAYAEHVKPIALTLCFQGCRVQEALQLDWRHVDLARETIFFERTKNGEPRTVRMHQRVYAALAGLWTAQDEPKGGHVFPERSR